MWTNTPNTSWSNAQAFIWSCKWGTPRQTSTPCSTQSGFILLPCIFVLTIQWAGHYVCQSNSSLMQISNQPITWLHWGRVKAMCWCSNWASKWKEGYLSDSECGLVVGWNIFSNSWSEGIISWVCKEWQKKEKSSMSCVSPGENASCWHIWSRTKPTSICQIEIFRYMKMYENIIVRSDIFNSCFETKNKTGSLVREEEM